MSEITDMKVKANVEKHTVSISTEEKDDICRVTALTENDYYSTFKLKSGKEVNVEITGDVLIISGSDTVESVAEIDFGDLSKIRVFSRSRDSEDKPCAIIHTLESPSAD